MAERADNKW